MLQRGRDPGANSNREREREHTSPCCPAERRAALTPGAAVLRLHDRREVHRLRAELVQSHPVAVQGPFCSLLLLLFLFLFQSK